MSGEPLLAPAVHRDRRATWLRGAALVALWSIPGLISASQLSFVWSPDLPFGVALLWQMPPWWFWALATPVILLYWGILAAGHAAEYQRRFRERAVAAAQLEGKLAQAQLEALRMQLHPRDRADALPGPTDGEPRDRLGCPRRRDPQPHPPAARREHNPPWPCLPGRAG